MHLTLLYGGVLFEFSHRIRTYAPYGNVYIECAEFFADDVLVGLPCVRINLLALLLCLFACGLL